MQLIGMGSKCGMIEIKKNLRQVPLIGHGSHNRLFIEILSCLDSVFNKQCFRVHFNFFTMLNSNMPSIIVAVIIAQWFAWWLATREVLGSNLGQGENY